MGICIWNGFYFSYLFHSYLRPSSHNEQRQNVNPPGWFKSTLLTPNQLCFMQFWARLWQREVLCVNLLLLPNKLPQLGSLHTLSSHGLQVLGSRWTLLGLTRQSHNIGQHWLTWAHICRKWRRFCHLAHAVTVPCGCKTRPLFARWLLARGPSRPLEASHIH